MVLIYSQNLDLDWEEPLCPLSPNAASDWLAWLHYQNFEREDFSELSATALYEVVLSTGKSNSVLSWSSVYSADTTCPCSHDPGNVGLLAVLLPNVIGNQCGLFSSLTASRVLYFANIDPWQQRSGGIYHCLYTVEEVNNARNRQGRTSAFPRCNFLQATVGFMT